MTLVKRCGTLLDCELKRSCALYKKKPDLRTMTFHPPEIGEHCHSYVPMPKSRHEEEAND